MRDPRYWGGMAVRPWLLLHDGRTVRAPHVDAALQAIRAGAVQLVQATITGRWGLCVAPCRAIPPALRPHVLAVSRGVAVWRWLAPFHLGPKAARRPWEYARDMALAIGAAVEYLRADVAQWIPAHLYAAAVGAARWFGDDHRVMTPRAIQGWRDECRRGAIEAGVSASAIAGAISGGRRRQSQAAVGEAVQAVMDE